MDDGGPLAARGGGLPVVFAHSLAGNSGQWKVQLEHLRTHPSVQAALQARTLRLHGWVYHFEQGKVEAYDALAGKFVPLAQQVRLRLLEHGKDDQGPRSVWDTHI